MRQIYGLITCLTLTGLARTGAEKVEGVASRPQVDLLKQAVQTFAATNTPAGWAREIRFDREGAAPVAARWTFVVADLTACVALELEKPLRADEWRLNGTRVPVPLEGMRYTHIPAIPAALLRTGTNVLEGTWTVDVRKGQDTFDPPAAYLPARLLALTAADLEFQTGPVLGCAGADYFTVACRTRLPAAVTLDAGGLKQTSPAGLMHVFRLTGLKSATPYAYTLTASLGAVTRTLGPFTTRTLPDHEPFTFAALGDSRTNPDAWAKVAAAVAAAAPAFTLFGGDMVVDGRVDQHWDEQFFGVAKAFCATLPCFYVQGNHEGNSPLFYRLIPTPGGATNWTQAVGPVLIIGINGELNWSDKGPNLPWLEGVLVASRAKYIFMETHYPAWTSGTHGALQAGAPRERPVREAQQFILPLLKKYHATAMFAGHDHLYERSEPPDGVTVIITGGAGAPLYQKVAEAEKQNPYSKAFASRLHYCLVSVTAEHCRLRALTPEGEELDTREWSPRDGVEGSKQP